jgi:hypothetical protein
MMAMQRRTVQVRAQSGAGAPRAAVVGLRGAARPSRAHALKTVCGASPKNLPSSVSSYDDDIKEQSRKFRRTVFNFESCALDWLLGFGGLCVCARACVCDKFVCDWLMHHAAAYSTLTALSTFFYPKPTTGEGHRSSERYARHFLTMFTCVTWFLGGLKPWLFLKGGPAQDGALWRDKPLTDAQPRHRHTVFLTKTTQTLPTTTNQTDKNSSRVVRGLARPLIYIAGVSSAVVAYETARATGVTPDWAPSVQLNSKEVFGLTSFALSLLLVFRTNASYERWDGARKMWGLMLNRSRDIVRQVRGSGGV